MVIPGGLTYWLQPADLMWFKPLKMSIRNSSNEWLTSDDVQRTRGGNIRQPPAAILRGWLRTVWNEITIKKSFNVGFLGPVEVLQTMKLPWSLE